MQHTLAVVIATHRPWPSRAAAALAEAWHAYRERRAQHRAVQALRGLSAHTLRDIGLAEVVPPPVERLPVVDWAEGRW